MKAILLLMCLSLFSCLTAESFIFPRWMKTSDSTAVSPRWTVNSDGILHWNLKNETALPHYDHTEAAGFKSAAIISYGVETDKQLVLQRHLVFPMLRTVPNDTHASFAHNVTERIRPGIFVNGTETDRYYVNDITLNEFLTFSCRSDTGLLVIRRGAPAVTKSAYIERWTIINDTGVPVRVHITDPGYSYISPEKEGVYGSYEIKSRTVGTTDRKLLPGQSTVFFFVLAAGIKGYVDTDFDPSEEGKSRTFFAQQLSERLILETPEPILDTMFRYAKLRACESIFETKCGLMHSPGGGSYYAAVWTNDQCEYVNPFFPFSGYETGNQQAVNCYKMYEKYMGDFDTPLITSIVAEGDNTWSGAGDRGDAAMYAYGAARFALSYGDLKTAEELFPAIEWCLEYSRRKLNSDGVVLSDSDELEGRFPSGKANLNTSSLYYDALVSASALASELNDSEKSTLYARRAAEMKSAIENYFGADMSGFRTYRYYKENEKLRSWIAVPLTAGIFDRAEETADALYSPLLWSENGLLTEAGSKTFWDRSTLYAFRGTLYAGDTERTVGLLKKYSENRLLGEHVPYPVEAWPEGNQKHLSAESSLYCRIFTEGLFGIRPTGLRSFSMIPQLPKEWAYAHLRKIAAFGNLFDIDVVRSGDDPTLLTVTVSCADGRIVFSQTVAARTPLDIDFRSN